MSVAVRISPPPRPGPPPELDEFTLALAQRGDAAARRALVVRYQRPIFALLGRMFPGPGERPRVEDLAQETFLRVLRALPEFRRGGPTRLSTWILTIASNLAIDAMRRSRRVMVPIDAEALAVADDEAPLSGVERSLLARALGRAIDGLSPEHRAAFLLREYHELSYAEISEALGIDLGTVKSRLCRARAALREALREVHDAR